jgi:excisionase family DNA binding protein
LSKRRNRAYTIGEAVEEINSRTGLAVSAAIIRRACQQGVIRGVRPGTGLSWWRIPAAELERYIKART